MGFPVYTTSEYAVRLTAIDNESYPVSPNAAMIHLYKNDVSPDANMTVETFEEADFEGAAALELVMGSPSLNDQGIITVRSGLCEWTAPEGTTPQTVYGIYVTDNDATKIIAAQRFDTPQVMGGALATSVSGVWRSSEPLTNYGWIDVES